MGQSLECACFENMFGNGADGNNKASQERVELLQKGNNFKRKAYLGLTMQDISINLSNDTSAIQWKTIPPSGKWANMIPIKEEKGEIDLTTNIKTVKLFNELGMQFVGLDDTIVFELQAADAQLRDFWVVSLNELLQTWKEHPELKPKSSISADGTSNKDEYFRNKEAELVARQKANAERKAKYASGGMKYTAQAMANRA
eukprot:gene4160-5924_t